MKKYQLFILESLVFGVGYGLYLFNSGSLKTVTDYLYLIALSLFVAINIEYVFPKIIGLIGSKN